MPSLFDRVAKNPFYVLDITPAASRMEIERMGQKWLALLGVESAAATTYDTPLGPFPRDAEAIRTALAQLRDAEQRVLWEVWWQGFSTAPSIRSACGFEHTHQIIGWRRSWRRP